MHLDWFPNERELFWHTQIECGWRDRSFFGFNLRKSSPSRCMLPLAESFQRGSHWWSTRAIVIIQKPSIFQGNKEEKCPWKIECFLEDLFLGSQWSIILGYIWLSVKFSLTPWLTIHVDCQEGITQLSSQHHSLCAQRTVPAQKEREW